MESNNHELEVLLQTAARVKVIEERFDRHLAETRDEIKLVRSSIDDLKDILTEARIDTVEKHGSLKAKMAGLSAVVALIMHFLTSFIHDKISK